ncbi:MAG: DedA family protein [Patescibacteria group bacterium]|nr:DedA family protein [Patescibacteria group bacterium]MDD4611290.1 DedA family protein [Patescibacteria group bacterium]
MSLLSFFLQIIHNLGYGGVVFLMAIESSFLPLPSEIIIPPAAYLASQGEMNIFLIIIAGTIGSVIGALINYTLAYYLGRTIIFGIADSKFGKLIMLNSKKIEKAENFFLRYGNASTFIGRLLPVVRHLISIPAGFSEMKLRNFIFYTTTGAFVWVSILAALGYYLGEKVDVIIRYYKEISYFIILVLMIYGIYRWRKKF